jgi:hypothetical protein
MRLLSVTSAPVALTGAIESRRRKSELSLT